MKASPEAPSIEPLTTNWPQQGSKLPIVIELPKPEDVDSSQLDYALESAESLVNHRSPRPPQSLFFSVSKAGPKYLYPQLPSYGDSDAL